MIINSPLDHPFTSIYMSLPTKIIFKDKPKVKDGPKLVESHMRVIKNDGEVVGLVPFG